MNDCEWFEITVRGNGDVHVDCMDSTQTWIDETKGRTKGFGRYRTYDEAVRDARVIEAVNEVLGVQLTHMQAKMIIEAAREDR